MLEPLICKECEHEYYKSQSQSALHPDLFCSEDCEIAFATQVTEYYDFGDTA
jgi:hypothetical protein